jgi:hypothetical protein
VSIHGRSDLRFGWLWNFRQQLGSLDNHPVVAVAALNCLFVDQRLLHWMQCGWLLKLVLLCVSCLQSNAINQDRAGAALGQTATESGSLKEQLV